jgi:hypothetical protein
MIHLWTTNLSGQLRKNPPLLTARFTLAQSDSMSQLSGTSAQNQAEISVFENKWAHGQKQISACIHGR